MDSEQEGAVPTRPQGINLDGVSRLLFVRLGRLGDLLAASWLFKTLKAGRPDLHLSLLTLKPCRELLLYNRDLEDVHFYRRWMPLEALAWMRRGRFQVLVDLNDSASRTTAGLCRFSGAPFKAGFRFGKYGGSYDLAVPAPSPESSHILERLAQMGRALGLNPDPAGLRPCMVLGDEPQSQVRAHLKQARRGQGPLVALNLSAGHASRMWTPQGWENLAARLGAAAEGLEMVVLAKPSELASASRLASRGPQGRMILPAWHGFQHFAAYIREADLLVSPDTSAIHIASAFERPVVGLYPDVAWNLASWRPFGTRFEVCLSRARDQGDFDPREVFQKAAALLQLKEVNHG